MSATPREAGGMVYVSTETLHLADPEHCVYCGKLLEPGDPVVFTKVPPGIPWEGDREPLLHPECWGAVETGTD